MKYTIHMDTAFPRTHPDASTTIALYRCEECGTPCPESCLLGEHALCPECHQRLWPEKTDDR